MGRVNAITIPYKPREHLKAFHNRKQRFACLVAHRRFGKTVGVLNDLIRSAMTNPRKSVRVGYIAPYFKQAKAISWDYCKHYTSVIPGRSVNESELRIDFPTGARLQLFGADNYDAMRGMYFDDVALDEPADFPADAWRSVIRPALSDRKGRATFMGTPKGKNEFWEIYDNALTDPEWYCAMLKASQTGVLDEDELASLRKEMGEDRYEQEYECSFEAAIQGAYFGKEMRLAEDAGRIKKILIEPAINVITAWDLGVGDSTAIWFAQFVGQERRMIDYYEASGVGMDHYAKVLQDKGYLYGMHILPHDVRVRELGSGKTRLETLASLGIHKVDIAPNMPLDDGIQATRLTLPNTWFDAERCRLGIEALRQYRQDWDDKGKTWRSRPRHDWTSHGADAFRYMSIGYKGTSVANWGKPIKRGIKGIV